MTGLRMVGMALLAAGGAASAPSASGQAAQAVASEPAAPDVPLAPSGKWVAAFENSMCVLSRGYGVGDSYFDLAFRPLPGDPKIEIVLVLPRAGGEFLRSGDATVELLPSHQKATARFRDYTVKGPGKGLRLARFFVDRAEIGDLTSAKSMRVTMKRVPPVHVALSNTAAAMRMIAKCEDELVRRWGFDPEVMRTLIRWPKLTGKLEDWVSYRDYPVRALQAGESGAVRTRFTVNIDGSVQGCLVVQSSGSKVLDETSCALIGKSRYLPAIAADGKPVASPSSVTMQWDIGR